MKWNKALGAVALAGIAGGCAFDAGTLEEEPVGEVSQAEYFEYWIGPISDEYGAVECSEEVAGVTGAQCRGKYCDNNYLKCSQLVIGGKVAVTDLNTRYTTKYISEEFPNNEAHCDGPGGSDMTYPSGIVVGMQAKGANSDFIRLVCAEMPRYYASNCSWTDWFSEEGAATAIFRFGSYVTGVRCRGKYCDQVSYELCEWAHF